MAGLSPVSERASHCAVNILDPHPDGLPPKFATRNSHGAQASPSEELRKEFMAYEELGASEAQTTMALKLLRSFQQLSIPTFPILFRDPSLPKTGHSPRKMGSFQRERWVKRMGNQPLEACPLPCLHCYHVFLFLFSGFSCFMCCLLVIFFFCGLQQQRPVFRKPIAFGL